MLDFSHAVRARTGIPITWVDESAPPREDGTPFGQDFVVVSAFKNMAFQQRTQALMTAALEAYELHINRDRKPSEARLKPHLGSLSRQEAAMQLLASIGEGLATVVEPPSKLHRTLPESVVDRVHMRACLGTLVMGWPGVRVTDEQAAALQDYAKTLTVDIDRFDEVEPLKIEIVDGVLIDRYRDRGPVKLEGGAVVQPVHEANGILLFSLFPGALDYLRTTCRELSKADEQRHEEAEKN